MKLYCNSCDGIYHEFLDVRFGRQCDNNCSFCIEKTGVDDKGINVDNLIKSTLESGKKGVLILGGEPLLVFEKVAEYIKGIKEHIKFIYLTTSLPKTIDLNNEYIKYIFDNLTGLNISLQHYDYEKNNEILNASSKHNRIELLSEMTQKYGDIIRVSINLVRNGIDTKDELINFLKTMQSINVKHVKINELQTDDENLFVSFEDMCGVNMKSPFANGCQTDESDLVRKYIYSDSKLKITLKRSCFNTAPRKFMIEKTTFSDLVKSILKKCLNKKFPEYKGDVLYEDGTLTYKWLIK